MPLVESRDPAAGDAVDYNRSPGDRKHRSHLGDAAVLPLLGALLAVYFFAMTPVFNTIVRVNEAEADLFGLNAARQPDGFATVALKLAANRTLEPGPVEEWIFYDHPSGRSRIRMAMEWKAEHLATETGR